MNDDSSADSYQRKRPHNSEGTDSTEHGRRLKRQHNSSSEALPLLKILIPNYAAGAIIGKGGTNIGDLQSQYGAKIRLSPSREYYPGTEERIVVLTGEVNQIIDLNNYIIDKVHIDSADSSSGASRSRDEDRGQKVKIVVPNATAGLVIGRGGATIKALQEETGAKIMISSRDEAKVSGERIITISGNTDQRIDASAKVISKVAADAENMANKNLTYSGSSVRNGGHHYSHSSSRIDNLGSNISSLQSVIGNLQSQQAAKGSQNIFSSLAQNPLAALQQTGLASQLGLGGAMSGGLGGLNAQQLASLTGLAGGGTGSLVNSIKTQVTIQMEIPDILVGAILGKQGKTVHEFIQFSGAKIQFSGKNDFAPGTTDRILTIQGDVNQSQIAYFLINQKIVQAENELATGLQRH